MIQFRNTKIAFAHKTNRELKNAYLLFYSFGYLKTISFLGKLAVWLLKLKIPIKFLIKSTLFKQFVGGENIQECRKTVQSLFKHYSVGSILDYSVEGAENSESYKKTKNEIISTIHEAYKEEAIPFSVFKISAFSSVKVLSSSNPESEYPQEWKELISLISDICQEAANNNIPILIDAEESWLQNNIDFIAESMMTNFNKDKTIVFNTIQLYRHDKLEYLQKVHQSSIEKKYHLGVKLVRGAYVEKENNYAKSKNLACVLHNNKEAVDKDYDIAIKYCLENISSISSIIATHNESSTLYAIKLMEELGIQKSNPKVFFAQLYGMSDHISFNLINHGYNTVKYMPYGPVADLMPYLLRRAQENKSIQGQSGRELTLIKKELKRRKLD